MSARAATRQYRLSQWLPIIQECQASGMSVRSWCVQNDINEQRFYYWQRIMREIASESLPVVTQESKFVQLPTSIMTPVPSKQGEPRFVPSMVIRVGKVSVELTDDVQPELLATVLRVLSDA